MTMKTMIKLQKTENHDRMDRRIYLDIHNKTYVDVNLNDDHPIICTTCKCGEPEYPVQFEIVETFRAERDWLCVERAAEYYGVSKATVYRWIKKGEIKSSMQLFGGYKIVDIDSRPR